MGRNSAEATKASLIRAVLARRAALTLGLTGFLAVLPALLAGVVDFFAVALVGFAVALAGLAGVVPTGFFAVVLMGLAAVAPTGFFAIALAGVFPTGFFTVGDGFWTGFLVASAGFFAGVEAVPAGAVAVPPEDCPANGSTISSVESRTARRRLASRGPKVREDATLISSL
jgi:DNA-binding transcriptional regulator YdaS (Cro superfamily)